MGTHFSVMATTYDSILVFYFQDSLIQITTMHTDQNQLWTVCHNALDIKYLCVLTF